MVAIRQEKLQFHFSVWRSNLVSCERVARSNLKLQFYLSFWRSNLISCERVARDNLISQFYLSFWRSKSIEPHFVRKGCAGQLDIAILLQFLTIEPHFVQKGARDTELALLPQLLTIEPHFVRKSARDTLKSQFYFSFWRSNLISCERVARDDFNSHFYRGFWRSNLISWWKGARDTLQIAILPQFLAIEPRFVRKGCVSCRLVGTAPAPAFRREIEKKERARGQEGKRRRCEDERMWRWEDEIQTPTIGRTLRSNALGNSRRTCQTSRELMPLSLVNFQANWGETLPVAETEKHVSIIIHLPAMTWASFLDKWTLLSK